MTNGIFILTDERFKLTDGVVDMTEYLLLGAGLNHRPTASVDFDLVVVVRLLAFGGALALDFVRGDFFEESLEQIESAIAPRRAERVALFHHQSLELKSMKVTQISRQDLLLIRKFVRRMKSRERKIVYGRII